MNSIISIQGEASSFHDIAARQFFGDASERIYCDTFTATIQALENGNASFALCAIENSLYGSINEVYDLLLNDKLFVFGEVYLRIEQCLIGLPGSELSDITHVYSHPVALGQCEAYLDEQLPKAERIEHHDTAASVEFIKEAGNPTYAAIASREAAELHGMTILANSIETNKENYTRFVAISTSRDNMPRSPNKTSIVFTTDHTPGALQKALSSFAARGINLSKVQSRPIIGKAWHYMFYADLACGMNGSDFTTCLQELKQQGCKVSLVGSYRSGL